MAQKDAEGKRMNKKNKVDLKWCGSHNSVSRRKHGYDIYKRPLHVAIKDKPQILNMTISGAWDFALFTFFHLSLVCMSP